MIFERIKSAGIAHNSYIIGSGSDAAVIDPRRDCQIYVDYAQEKGLKIKYIFETHRNEDYVIGSVELNTITGAEIHHGPGIDWKYGNTLGDGQQFRIGSLRLTTIHTPGHTDESISYKVADLATGEAPVLVFTGDALFVGDVGRTDLYGPKEASRLASNLYDSIFNKLLPLGDGIILCPAHGGGSVCGLHIANRDESTIGIERIQNPALQMKDKHEFVKHKLAEKPEMPHYFRQMEIYNLEGPPLLGCLPLPSPLTPAEFKQEIDKGAVVVDTSEPAAFGGAHIKGAYSIWLEGLPIFGGWVLPYDKPILLVLEDQSHLERAVRYLIRAGYDQIVGYLRHGTEGWYNAGFPTESLPLLSVHQLKSRLDRREELVVLDTRGQDEWESGHIAGALHIYVGYLEQRLAEVPKGKPIAVICNVGHRAGLGASILLRAGCPSVHNVLGSVKAWIAAGFPVTTDEASEQ
ncbi:MAG: MBL fold metallo-hydrolase [Chloroflexi bacterium RBG_13_51_36]|nr:MAG: MBL fold metallo-hydrolase [Chloroflexi bacterium RBG_13_51_36]